MLPFCVLNAVDGDDREIGAIDGKDGSCDLFFEVSVGDGHLKGRGNVENEVGMTVAVAVAIEEASK